MLVGGVFFVFVLGVVGWCVFGGGVVWEIGGIARCLFLVGACSGFYRFLRLDFCQLPIVLGRFDGGQHVV